MQTYRTRNYLAGLVTGYAATLVTVAVGLWLTPFTLRFLDREEYAIFALTGDILMWLNLLDLGITAGLNVQAAQLTGRPDQDRLNRLASTAFFTQIAVVGMVIVAGAGITLAFPSFFHVRPELQTQTMQVVALLVFSSVMGMGTQTFSALLIAHQQIHIDNLIRLGLIAIRTALTVILLLAGWKLLSLAVASVVATGFIAVLAVWRAFRTVPGLTIRRRLASWKIMRSMGSLGIWFSLGGLAGIVVQGLDRIVAARLISIESVTTLSLTGRVYALSGGLLAQITNTARPALGQLLGQGKMDDAYQTYRHLFALSSGGAIVVALSLWAGNVCFVPWWVGPQNYGGGWLDLALALNLIVHAWVLPNRATLAAGFTVRPMVINRLIEGLLNLVMAILLGIHFGLIGIVVSTSIAGIITSCWYLPRLTARLFNRRFSRFLFDDAVYVLIASSLLAPIAWGARALGMLFGGISGASLAMVLTAGIGLSFFWIIAFDQTLRGRVRNTFAMAWRIS
jgi:O-antigen/teichoic acid export membrane protein